MLNASTSEDFLCCTVVGDSGAGTGSLTFRLQMFVLRMSDIISRRQRTPWFWPDFVYYYFGDGREHNSTLKVLHSFTYKVSIRSIVLEAELLDLLSAAPSV